MTTTEQPNLANLPDQGTPAHVVLLKITMWTVFFLGLLGVMVVYMLN